MSLQWNYSTNNTLNPGAPIKNENNSTHTHTANYAYFGAEKLLSDFQTALSDHKKKQNNLIQNFLSSNSKFDEVTSYFMSKINPTLKHTTDQFTEENKLLRAEIGKLKSEITNLKTHIESEKKRREQTAVNIMRFCDSEINPTEFEHFVGALFSALGYKVEHCGKTHDGGIDLVVRHFKNGKGVVQVKQYRKNTKVTEPQIRDLFGAMSAKQEVEYGIMVVLSDCTKEAKTWPQRENVTNLKIWTHKELVSLLEEKGNETLIEFIKALKGVHESDIRNANSHFITPQNKHSHKNSHYFYSQQQSKQYNTNLRQRSANKSKQRCLTSLSSAKKEKRKDVMRQGWSNFKFSDTSTNHGNGKQTDKENLKNPNIISPKPKKHLKSNGETSPYSSNDSSLFIDELQSDHDSDKGVSEKDFHRINNKFNGPQMSDLNTKFLWSLQNNTQNMNIASKPRRPRRAWSQNDDIVLVNAIKQFGTNWNETDQMKWEQIYEHCTFSHDFAIKAIKKHYSQVLKPKILCNGNSSPSKKSNRSSIE